MTFGFSVGDLLDCFFVGFVVLGFLLNVVEECLYLCVVDDVQWFD